MSPSRAGLLLLAAAAIAAFFVLGLDEYLDLDAIKRERMRLVGLWHDAPALTAAIFIALHATALALSLPGAVLSFTLAAGAIFGPWWGTAIALTSIILGDSLAFLGARFLFRDWVERTFSRQAERANRGFARDGAFYLLALRLMAVVPYFVVNLTMGLTRMKLRLFAPVSFVGLLPATFLYVQAGSQLSTLQRASDIYSPGLLITFGLLGVLPLAARLTFRRWRSRSGRDDPLI